MYSKIFDVFGRHERIALQVSGGIDSLAVLHGVMPWIDRVCVYWLNPGNPFPETLAIMDEIREVVPHFREVAGLQKHVVKMDGWPSDLVPVRWTTQGHFSFGPKPFKVQGRLDCCVRSLMKPLHRQMDEDGITCIIRGKRADEVDKTPTRTGTVLEGFEFIYPIWDWTSAQVLQYLTDNNVPIPPSYEYATHSLDCMDCTAWWGEGLDRFLEAKYPKHHKQYVKRTGLIRAAIAEELANLEI
jgi:phosphoadenosine phosphosulfate reductase